jgi:hypothetical protein
MKNIALITTLLIPNCAALTPGDIDDIFIRSLNQHPEHNHEIKTALAPSTDAARNINNRFHEVAHQHVLDYCKKYSFDYDRLPKDLKRDIDFAAKRLSSNMDTLLASNKRPASPEKVLNQALDRILGTIIIPGTKYFESDTVGQECANEISTLLASLKIPADCITPSITTTILTCQEKSHNAARELMKRAGRTYVTNREINAASHQHKQLLIKQLWFLVQGYVFQKTRGYLLTEHASDTIYELHPGVAPIQAIADHLKTMITDL